MWARYGDNEAEPTPKTEEAAGEKPRRDRATPRFGERGQFVVQQTALIGAGYTAYDSGGATSLSIGIGPGFDYFALRDFSVGFGIDVDYLVQRGYLKNAFVRDTVREVSGGFRIGYNVRLGRRVSLYPRVFAGVHDIHENQVSDQGRSAASIAESTTGSPNVSRTGPFAEVEAELLFHIVPSFFVAAGAFAYHDFSRAGGGPDIGAELTRTGARFGIGGYWGGGPTPAADVVTPVPDADPAYKKLRFGDASCIVFTGDAAFAASWSSYAGSDASARSTVFRPSLDYFLADHVSIGGAFRHSDARSVLVGSNAATREVKSAFNGAELRIGFEGRLGERFSFFPVISYGVGVTHWTSSDPSDYQKTTVTVGVTAPLLAHVGPHLFIGFGPTIAHDFVGSLDYGAENRRTSIGLSTLLGGWL